MESVQKQWPEVVSAYQYVLTFLFMGERPGALGSPKGAGTWGRKAGAPFACVPKGKGTRRGPEFRLGDGWVHTSHL